MSIEGRCGVRIRLVITNIIVFTLLPCVSATQAEGLSITAESLLSWMDASRPPLVLDVRGRSAYRTATVAGAIDAGLDPSGYLPDDSTNAVVLIIPVDADSEFIEAWFKRLANAGHKVWILEHGFAAWTEAGGPIDSFEATYILPGTVPFTVPKGICHGNTPALIFE